MVIKKTNMVIKKTRKKRLKKINKGTLRKVLLKKNNPIISHNNNTVSLINNHFILNGYYSNYHKYTYINQFLYCKKILNLIKYDLDLPRKINILCLGFGIGGIPLRSSTFTNVKKIDCVDLDYSLFEIFNTIIKKKTPKICLYWNDAIDYLKYSKYKYNVILDDVYDGRVKIEYNYNLISPRLKKNGYFIINWFQSNNVPRILEILKTYFSSVKHYLTGNNVIIVCQHFFEKSVAKIP